MARNRSLADYPPCLSGKFLFWGKIMKINKSLTTLAGGAGLLLLAVSGSALADEPSVTYKFGGYAKLDAMFSDYSDGTPGGNTLMRHFYYAPQIPVGDGSSSDDMTTDFHARETRLNFRADATTAGGDKVTAFVEFDFLIDNNNGNSDSNEIVSNSYEPRLRHAFVKYNNWTFGQTWSTFQDVVALPEALDFVGPAESTTFIRQAMIRYTNGPLELAIENPEEFVAGDVTGRGYSSMPDLIARYTFKLDGGSYVKLAGLARSIKLQPSLGSQKDATGYGISASTKIVFDNGSDLRAMLTYGDGVGRYIGLGFVRDGYTTISDDEDPVLAFDTVKATAGFVAYRFKWNEKWRSNIMYGMTTLDYDSDLRAGELGLNDEGSSFHFNVIYNALPKLDIGAELIWGERVARSVLDDDGTDVPITVDGDFTRLMLSAKYAF
jgi:hypothetical protein